MKKVLSVIMFFMVMVFAVSAFAVVEGSCTQSLTKYRTANPDLMVLTFTCLGSDNDGDFPSIGVTGAITADIVGWYITGVRTNPGDGAAAPQALWDVAIKDSDGIDMMSGLLADRSATLSQAVSLIPIGIKPIVGTLSLVITGNNVTSATMTIKVFLAR